MTTTTKTNGKQKTAKNGAANNGNKHKAVQALPDSTLRGKPSSRKRVLPRPRPASKESTADKRRALMEAADATVKDVQKFKHDLEALEKDYPVIMVNKPCEGMGLAELFKNIEVSIFKDGKEFKQPPHNHTYIYKMDEKVGKQLTSRYTADVGFAIVKDRVLKAPMENVTYYPVQPLIVKAGFWRSVYRTFFGHTHSVEDVREAIEKGTDAFIKQVAQGDKSVMVVPVH